MPNWCENDLHITTSSKEELVVLLDFIRSKVAYDGTLSAFDFNNVIPYPLVYEALDKAANDFIGDHKDRPVDGYNQGGYEWCRKSWGVKWNACEVKVKNKRPRGCVISFSTPWVYPQPVIERLSRLFPKVEFDLMYFECGAAFQGGVKFKAGEIMEQWTGTYNGERGG